MAQPPEHRDAEGLPEDPTRPLFVTTPAQAERWRQCVAVAMTLEDTEVMNEQVWYASRSLYHSDIPTGEAGAFTDLPAPAEPPSRATA